MADDFVEVKNPHLLDTDRLLAQRIPVGGPGHYKPCIAQLPNRELLVVAFRTIDEGDGKYREDNVLFRSRDGGRTWSEGIILKQLGREPYLTVLRSGAVLMTALLGHDRRNGFGYFPSYVHRSEDGGRTWMSLQLGEELLPPPAERETYKGNQVCTTRNVLEQTDGSLFLGVSVYGMRRDFMWRSTDGGKTWSEKYPSRIEDLPQDYPYGAFQEAWLWQTRSGTLAMIARRDHRLCPIPGRTFDVQKEFLDEYDCMVLYVSTDIGRTWTPARPLGDYGEHYPSILRLRNGRLLLTFTVRTLKPPLGLQAVLGTEEEAGLYFDFDHDRILLDTKTPVDLPSGGGFGPTVQLPDGTLVSSYSYRHAHRPETDLSSDVRTEVVRWRLPPGANPL